MPAIAHPDGYELSDDPDRLDADRVHHWLSTDAYWAVGRPRDVFDRTVAGSVVFGVYRVADGDQVAFARVVTDGAVFGYLCDVYVEPAERGRGLGGWMVGAVRDHLAALGLRRLLLITGDAHGVYARLGFAAVSRPGDWMEIDLRQLPVTSTTGKDPNAESPLR